MRHKMWDERTHREVDPLNKEFIADDSQVIKIQAENILGNPDDTWYEVVLKGD